MRLRVAFLSCLTVLAASGSTALGQEPLAGSARSADGVWQPATDQAVPASQRRADIDGPYAVVQLDRSALEALLVRAPNETDPNRNAQPVVVVTLPLPDGRFSRFRVEESPILAPDLAAAFPEIRTYRGAGLDDPTATARFDITPDGFHGMVIAAGGTVYIDPYRPGDLVNHVSFDKANLRRTGAPFGDLVDGATDLPRVYNELPITNGTILRTYRLALAATAQYTAAAGGTKAAALSRMTTTMNRVNGIYERELAVRMTVATGTGANPTALIYDAEPDPYTNDDGFAMLTENQTNVTAVVGTANFDIGHVFSTGGGGVATLNSPCNASTKARGVTGLPNPVGDAFDVDYVAHEMGHQFGGNHTFNSISGSCGGGNRSAAHAFEVGSGSTIMAYAGICAPENTQLNSNDVFTFESLNEITAFITSGGGSICPVSTATGNTLPVVAGPGASFTIPVSTPFALTATANDANGDALTYIWEEHDLGNATSGGTHADDGSRPLFRSFVATSSPTRTFPGLAYILNNANVPPNSYSCGGSTCMTGELLPAVARVMNFQVTVRDNRAGGGGIATAQTTVTVGPSGPFAVTAPNTGLTWTGTSTQTVTWTVNGTDAIAANVSILLSTDGGLTFPTVLQAATPNDGSQTVTVPNTPTTTARIKVQASGNIFFDISNVNFTITPGGPPPGAFGKTAPAQGATGQSPSPTLTWGASSGVLSYEYCVDTVQNAACDTGWVSAGASTSATLSGLLPLTTYSWQVRAVNASGATLADAGTWWAFTTQALSNPLADLAIDFGPAYGLWSYVDAGGASPAWQQLHGLSPTRLARGDLDGNGRTDLIVTFPGYGVWAFMNNTSFVQLHSFDAGAIETGDLDGNGRDDIVLDFPGYGIWVRFDSGSWQQLHPSDASVIAVGNINGGAGGRADVVISFPGQGVWVYANNTAWILLHPLSAQDLEIGDLDGNGVGDLIVQFPGSGEWVLYNSTNWIQRHSLAASAIVTGNLDGDASGKSDMVIVFPGAGVWAFMNNASWTLLHGADAQTLATGDIDGDGKADLILSFPGYGIWVLKNLATWTAIHGLTPEALVSGRMNAN
jgi:hypothetical protein